MTNTEGEKNLGGRPTKYDNWITEEGLEQITDWARNGATQAMIANNIGISATTWYDWKNKFSELTNAYNKGQKESIKTIENALFKNATGEYETYERKYAPIPLEDHEIAVEEELAVEKLLAENPNATELEIKVARIRAPKTRMVLVEDKVKRASPNTAAQVFWLKNKDPKEWQDKRYYEGNNDVKISPLQGMSTDDIRKIALEGKK